MVKVISLVLLACVLVALQEADADDAPKYPDSVALKKLMCKDYWDCKRCAKIKKNNQCNFGYFSGVCHKTCSGCGPYDEDKADNCNSIAKQGKCFVRETVSPFVTPATRCEKSCCTGIIPLPTPTTPPHPYWGEWTQWAACSKTCKGGYRSRRRKCHVGDYAGYCEGYSQDNQQCNSYLPCYKVDGGWSDWGNWSSCQSSCGLGKRARSRSCSNPWPQSGGKPCEGSSEEVAKCYSGCCPEAGSWSQWSSWASCSKSCSSDGSRGKRERTRSCTQPRPYCGGPPCQGPFKQTQQCSTDVSCPTDAPSTSATWTGWGAWGPCSRTCSYGYKIRKRTCTNWKETGQYCTGYATEYDWCNKDILCP